MVKLEPSNAKFTFLFAHLGTLASAFSALVTFGCFWIIDSGTSNHMIGCLLFFLLIIIVLVKIGQDC